MQFVVKISLDNEAFANDRIPETARILRELASKIEADWFMLFVPLQDINGNSAGYAKVMRG